MDSDKPSVPQTALRPSFGSDFASLSDPIDRPEEKVAPDPEESALAFLGHTDGWNAVSKHIDELIQELEDGALKLIAEGASFEAIGQYTTVKEQTKSYLNRVRSRVEDAKEALGGAEG